MLAVRLFTVLLIILAFIVTYSPQVHEQAVKTWEEIEPAFINITDSLVVTIRNFISGNRSKDRIDDTPVPGGDFERIITLDSSFNF